MAHGPGWGPCNGKFERFLLMSHFATGRTSNLEQLCTLLTLEQRERHGEEERPGADLALRKAAAAGVRVQVVAEAGHEVEIERGWHDDGDDRDEEEEAEAERLDVLKWKGGEIPSDVLLPQLQTMQM